VVVSGSVSGWWLVGVVLSANRCFCENLIRFTFGLVLTMALVSELHASDIPLLKSFVLEAW